ncbi:MAG TPA: ABC transporter ATP-binding protein, partial [Actinomycetota bacterium]|nr:ABC transporter ATP-binding protein [Actinomycetota bacterium]
MINPGRDDTKDVQLSKGLVRRVFKFAKPYRGSIVLAMIVILAAAVATGLGPQIIRRIIDEAITHRDKAKLNLLIALFLGLALAGSFLGIAMRYLLSRIGEGLIFDLRSSLFDHVQRMPVAFFTRTQTGALISRLNNDVIGAQRAVTETTAGLLQVIADLVVTLALMWSMQPRLTVISLLVVPLFVLPIRSMGKVLQRYVRQQMEFNASMNTQMTERFQIGGALLVKLFGNYVKERDHFAQKAGNVRDLGVKTAVIGRLFFVTFSVVSAFGTAMTYWLGGRMAISGEIKVGVIVAFSLYLGRLYGPITGLSNTPVEVKTALVSFDRVFEVLDFPSAIQQKPDAVELTDPRGKVEFVGVRFRYPPGSETSIPSLEEGRIDTKYDPEAWVLKDVSFTIEPGQMFALVGPSGAGKTTISMLVPRLYDAVDGTVLIDGIDVKDLTLPSLAASVGVVTQDSHMFHDTIRANL